MQRNPLARAEIRDYLRQVEAEDVKALALRQSPFEDVPMSWIAQQVKGRQVAKRKYPFLLQHPTYQYPPSISLEQATSEIVGEWKRTLLTGDSIIDLTGGMGIDTYFLSQGCSRTTYVEPDQDLYPLTMGNLETLGVTNLTGFHGTASDYLSSEACTAHDVLYIDPSRRDDHGGRKISIDRYRPNVVTLQHRMLELAPTLLIKLSPMQDISEAVSAIQHISDIYVLSIQHDVKELLILVKRDHTQPPIIHAIDLSPDITLAYQANTTNATIAFGDIQRYLYLPAPALIKSGLHDHHATSLGLAKLHPNTQIYTSDVRLEGFFGRVFSIDATQTLDKKNVTRLLPARKAHIISKNHPLSTEDIARKYKIKMGDNSYVIALTTYDGKKKIVVGEKVS